MPRVQSGMKSNGGHFVDAATNPRPKGMEWLWGAFAVSIPGVIAIVVFLDRD
jgi:hypothetical protein